MLPMMSNLVIAFIFLEHLAFSTEVNLTESASTVPGRDNVASTPSALQRHDLSPTGFDTSSNNSSLDNIIDENTLQNGTYPALPVFLQNRGMITRMTYVLVGVSLLIVVYFVIKAVKLRSSPQSRVRRYGVLASADGNSSTPLKMDESDEDEVEVFDVKGSNIRGGRYTRGASDRLLP